MPTSIGERDAARRRLAAQLLAGPPAPSPAEVVRHLVAVQSQEFAAARWSLGQRSASADAAVLAAYDRGEILRTHVLRPTWHFVLPEDIGWLQRLTGERVRRQDWGNARRAGVDEAMLGACVDVFGQALSGGRALTRAELRDALDAAGITILGPQLSHVTLLAEVDSLLTSGPVRGANPTFMLLDERVPRGRDLDGDEALAELTLRYLRSRGPAGERDLAWWSGLTLTQVRRGIQSVADRLEVVTVDDVTCWFDPSSGSTPVAAEGALMLQTFDELVVAYTQTRRFAYQDLPGRSTNPNSFDQLLLVDGQVVGTWRRGTGRRSHVMRVSVPAEHRVAVAAELERYAGFLGVEPFEVEWDAT